MRGPCRSLRQILQNGLDENIDRLAEHAFSGELWEKAVPVGDGSARRAMKRWANHEVTASSNGASKRCPTCRIVRTSGKLRLISAWLAS